MCEEARVSKCQVFEVWLVDVTKAVTSVILEICLAVVSFSFPSFSFFWCAFSLRHSE